jgi:hypothetical protein
MKMAFFFAGVSVLGLMALGIPAPQRAAAQDPIVTPVIAGEAAAPIVTKVITPKQKNTGLGKFQGYFLNGNIAQVTLKARGNDMAIQTFPLSEKASAKMQTIIDKGGYQYGDKITVYYDPQTHRALKFKGKPSRPL